MIDVIIPTMWYTKDFVNILEKYVHNNLINKIILIDNNYKKRPKSTILDNKKIELVSFRRNIFVNPAWNEGVLRATTDIIAIINDDVVVEKDIFEMILRFNLQENDIVGVNLRGYQDNYKIDDYIDTKEQIVKLNYDKSKAIGGQAWAFGICMFIKRESYKKIPSLYQIWYGDDYLCQRSNNVFGINTNKIKGKISETLKNFNDKNSAVSKRLVLDSKNFIRFGHFHDGQNWDLPNQVAKQKI